MKDGDDLTASVKLYGTSRSDSIRVSGQPSGATCTVDGRVLTCTAALNVDRRKSDDLMGDVVLRIESATLAPKTLSITAFADDPIFSDIRVYPRVALLPATAGSVSFLVLCDAKYDFSASVSDGLSAEIQGNRITVRRTGLTEAGSPAYLSVYQGGVEVARCKIHVA